MHLERTTPPAALPVSLSELKDHLRIIDEEDDAILAGYLAAVVSQLEEGELNRKLITQTWIGVSDDFGKCLSLPFPPVQSVSQIRYRDSDGAWQVLDPAEYRIVGAGSSNRRAEVHPALGGTFPATYSADDAVEVTFVAGYGDSWNDVPAMTRQLILVMAADYYEHRESVVTGSISTDTKGIAYRGLVNACKFHEVA